MENALSIINSGYLRGGNWEGGYVYAWKLLPSHYAVNNSGAHKGVIISFETKVAFVADVGIVDPLVKLCMPVVSLLPGPIPIENVKIVRWR